MFKSEYAFTEDFFLVDSRRVSVLKTSSSLRLQASAELTARIIPLYLHAVEHVIFDYSPVCNGHVSIQGDDSG